MQAIIDTARTSVKASYELGISKIYYSSLIQILWHGRLPHLGAVSAQGVVQCDRGQGAVGDHQQGGFEDFL